MTEDGGGGARPPSKPTQKARAALAALTAALDEAPPERDVREQPDRGDDGQQAVLGTGHASVEADPVPPDTSDSGG